MISSVHHTRYITATDLLLPDHLPRGGRAEGRLAELHDEALGHRPPVEVLWRAAEEAAGGGGV